MSLEKLGSLRDLINPARRGGKHSHEYRRDIEMDTLEEASHLGENENDISVEHDQSLMLSKSAERSDQIGSNNLEQSRLEEGAAEETPKDRKLKRRKTILQRIKKFVLSKQVFLPLFLVITLILVACTSKQEEEERLFVRAINSPHSYTKALKKSPIEVIEVLVRFTEHSEEESTEAEAEAEATTRSTNLLQQYPAYPATIATDQPYANLTEHSFCFTLRARFPDHELEPKALKTWCTELEEDVTEWLTVVDTKDYTELDKSAIEHLELEFTTPSARPIGFVLSVLQMGKAARYQVLIGAFVLVGVYALIVFELVHRAVASMLGALCVIAVLSQIRGRPSLDQLVEWIDADILMLLFGMMVIVAIFSKTGFFEWTAVRAYKLSKGNKWLIYVLLTCSTALISSILDNVTTMLLIGPVSVRLCQVLGMDFVPLLLSEAIMSNIGGTATLIGDPPNILIGNQLHLSFGSFIANLTLPVMACCAAVLVFVRIFYRNEFKGGNVVCDIQELEKQYRITDKPLLGKALPVLIAVVIMFFLAHVTHLSASWVAVIGALILILLGSPHEIESILHKVEWSTLLFFGTLFIIMEGINILGVIPFIATKTAGLISMIPSKFQLAFALVTILWVSAFTSAFIDNIPYAATMIPVVRTLALSTGLPLRPLAWALALGSCLGGNGTIVGASANVITVGICEHNGKPVSFMRFFKLGFPAMIITIVISTIYLLVAYALIGLSR